MVGKTRIISEIHITDFVDENEGHNKGMWAMLGQLAEAGNGYFPGDPRRNSTLLTS